MALLLFFLALFLTLILAARAESARQERDSTQFPPPGQIIKIGNLRLHINCKGSGSPTVILDAGLGDSSLVWDSVQPKIASFTRVCSYDRAGLGWSDPDPHPRTASRAAEELHAMLDRAGEHGPYILAGHSAGVNIVRMFVQAYPGEVAGLVMVEPPLFSTLNPTLVLVLRTIRSGLGRFARVGGIRLLGRLSLTRLLFGGVQPPAALSERIGYLYRPSAINASIAEANALPVTFQQLAESVQPGAWRDLPVIIIAAHKGSQPHADQLRLLERLAALSTKSEIRFVSGSHFVHFEHPDTVVDALQAIVSQSR